MKTKEELEKAIKDTIAGYKEIIFGADSPVYMVRLDELQKAASHRSKSVRAEVDGWYGEEARLGRLQKNIVMDGDTMIDGRTAEVLDP